MAQSFTVLQLGKLSPQAMDQIAKAMRFQIFLDVLDEIKVGQFGVSTVSITID